MHELDLKRRGSSRTVSETHMILMTAEYATVGLSVTSPSSYHVSGCEVSHKHRILRVEDARFGTGIVLSLLTDLASIHSGGNTWTANAVPTIVPPEIPPSSNEE